MAYTTNQLISGAYYAAGVVSREFETVSGSQIADGLQWLNEIIADKRVDNGMIPYETKYTFTANVGQEVYFIPNLIEIDTIVFFLDSVRYAMKYEKRNQYQGSFRVQNIQSLPFNWYFERQVNGGNLYIYFLPDQNYPMEIYGTFNIDSVELGDNLLANETMANLGTPIFYGSGDFSPGQLVVNGVDLMGSYANIGALTNYINSGIIASVRASININDFILSSTTEPPVPIYVQTNGYTPSGTRVKGTVATATTSNLTSVYNNGSSGIGATLTAPAAAILTIDGYVVALNDRVIVKNQTSSFQNGSYILSTLGTVSVPWVLTRTTNYDAAVEVQEGDLFTVTNGTVNTGLTLIQNSIVSNIGVSAITFANFNAITFSNFSTIGAYLYEVFNAAGFDQFYLTYLRYALADRICSEYNYAVPVGVARQLAEYQAWIKKKSRLIDLRMEKSSSLQKRGGYGYCFINLGRGWVSPG